MPARPLDVSLITWACLGLSMAILVLLLIGASMHGASIVYVGGFIAAIVGALSPIPGVLVKDRRVKLMSSVVSFANGAVIWWLWQATGRTWGQ